jgi:hypothetical protein
MLLILVLLLLFTDVLNEFAQPVVVVQSLEMLVLSVLLLKFLPFDMVANVLLLHESSQLDHILFLLYFGLFFFFVK